MTILETPSLSERLNQSRHIWDYWRPHTPHVVEMGTVRGRDVGLPTHFHAEDQITFVLTGRRRFYIGSELIEVSAGDAVRIPAGTAHRSLSESSEVVCVNLYTNATTRETRDFLTDLVRSRARGADEVLRSPFNMTDCATLGVSPVTMNDMDLLRWMPVSHAAARIGMTREGFSRKFKKTHGFSPQELGLMARLNNARRLLQQGHSIAAVAADSGFSDQSHLGRYFLRTFGVTPGRYRAG